jgi:SAM-dependent methyltransferase
MQRAKSVVKRLIPARLYAHLRAAARGEEYVSPPGAVRFGDLRRVAPLSRKWGKDRGRPVDRYYIENFLDRHRQDLRDRVLEVGDNAYTRIYGDGRVVQSDVLHVVEGTPGATFIGDITAADHIPGDAFDCVVFTQTLQLIFDAGAAIRTLHRILKPGGVLLCTFPGITPTGDREWGSSWYWSFTTRSAREIFARNFPTGEVTIESHGNVLAASAFLYGMADRELTRAELDHHDPPYDMIITVRAVKGE